MLCKICLRSLSILFTTTTIFFLFAQFKDDDKKRGAKQIVFFEEKFEDTSFASRGWYDNTIVSLSSTEHILASANSGEYHWKKGDTKPVNGGALRKKFPETDEVYISYWIKYIADFTGSNKPYHPHEFQLLTNKNSDYEGMAFTHLTAYIEQNEGHPLLALQDGQNIDQTKIKQDVQNATENRSVHGCNGMYADSSSNFDCYNAGNGIYWNGQQWKTSVTIPNGKWHHMEAYFKLNTVQNGKGVGNGLLKYWLDDKLIIDHTNVLMRTAQHADMKFNQFIIAPWIGDGSPIDQTFWLDDLVVANMCDDAK